PLAFGAFLLVSTPVAGAVAMGPVRVWEPLIKTVLYAAVAALAVSAAGLDDRGLADRVLASRPMVWLGEISYEIFLLHVLVMA
ncbi:MAG: acyltransferase, partial [Mycobacterium sp.]|nr:acyltransferase [Mycobacterium sp.]